MADPNIFNSLNVQPDSLYNYEFQKVQQPLKQIDPIVNIQHHYYYSNNPIHTTQIYEENILIPEKPHPHLGFSSSSSVLQETIAPTKQDQDWDTVKREVDMLKQEIVEKTVFYTNLKNKFMETESSWQEEKKELIAEISLMKASKRKESEIEKSIIQETDKDWEIKRLHQEMKAAETEWVMDKNVLRSELVNLKTQLAQANTVHRREEELTGVINRQNQQIYNMSRDLLEHRKREQLHVFNVNRLSAEVDKLNLVHQKTNAMEQELQKLNLELGRWYQKEENTDNEQGFNTLVTEQNNKQLQKRIYILESANYNLSEEIKRNREVIIANEKSLDLLTDLKVELARQQIEKVSILKQLQMVREELRRQKERKERKNKKKVEQVQYNLVAKDALGQRVIADHPGVHPYQQVIIQQPQTIFLPTNKPYDQRIRFLKQETQSLKNSLKEFS